jgi:hypothetical protein
MPASLLFSRFLECTEVLYNFDPAIMSIEPRRLMYYFTLRKGHYQRPLEEAIQTHASQWPRSWEGKNPLHRGHTFANMTPEERVRLL